MTSQVALSRYIQKVAWVDPITQAMAQNERKPPQMQRLPQKKEVEIVQNAFRAGVSTYRVAFVLPSDDHAKPSHIITTQVKGIDPTGSGGKTLHCRVEPAFTVYAGRPFPFMEGTISFKIYKDDSCEEYGMHEVPMRFIIRDVNAAITTAVHPSITTVPEDIRNLPGLSECIGTQSVDMVDIDFKPNCTHGAWLGTTVDLAQYQPFVDELNHRLKHGGRIVVISVDNSTSMQVESCWKDLCGDRPTDFAMRHLLKHPLSFFPAQAHNRNDSGHRMTASQVDNDSASDAPNRLNGENNDQVIPYHDWGNNFAIHGQGQGGLWYRGYYTHQTELYREDDDACVIDNGPFKIRAQQCREAYCPTTIYTNLLEMKQIEGAAALQDFEYETLHHFDPWTTHAVVIECPAKVDRRELQLIFNQARKETLRMEEGDKCKIGLAALNPFNEPDNDWIGTVVQSLPGMSDHHIRVLARQRPSNRQGLGGDPCTLSGVLPPTAIATAEQVRAIAHGERPFEITVRKKINQHAISAKIDTLQNVCHRASGGWRPSDTFKCNIKEIVLGGRTHTLPDADILGSLKLHFARIAALAERIGNAPVEALRSARGRVIVIDSPAGTGKTTLVRELMAACLQERLCASGDDPFNRAGTRLLAVTPTDEHSRRLTEDFYKRLVLEDTNTLVLRLRSKDTDLDYVAKQAGEAALWECQSSESTACEVDSSAPWGSKSGPVPMQHDAIHLLRVASMSPGKELPEWAS